MVYTEFLGYLVDITFMLMNETPERQEKILSSKRNHLAYSRKCLKKLKAAGIPPANTYPYHPETGEISLAQ